MTDLSVIILVGKEELHIKRCLEKLAQLEPRQVFIVESQHGDNTRNLAISTAKSLGWKVCDLTRTRPDAVVPTDAQHPGVGTQIGPNSACVEDTCVLNLIWHDWPSMQSIQFNWALDNLPIESEWVLRLDADEYLSDDGIAWLKDNLGTVPVKYNALEFTLERKFCGGLIRHGTNAIPMVRMFRRGTAHYSAGIMDERLLIKDEVKGKSEKVMGVPVVFYDDSLMPMTDWRQKHRSYAKREAQQAVASMQSGNWTDPRKASYYRLPPCFRAFAYFAIRYFLKGGILDGYAGWMWNFWQGLWYRLLVDREIAKLQNESEKA